MSMQSLGFSLDGRVAVVTGSTRGIGLATARGLAQVGARVVISSRKQEACEAVAAQLREEFGCQAIGVACHVARQEERERLIGETLKAWGRLDVLVANAAVNPVLSSMQDLGTDIWSRILETNLTAPWSLARLALPAMAANGGGAIILVSSIASLVASPGGGAYAVSKAAENHLARQLAYEWGAAQVRVNVVAPGTTRTDMIRTLMAQPGAESAAISQIPVGRLAAPEDIAAAILFLAMPAARHITGQVLAVDGGQTLVLGH